MNASATDNPFPGPQPYRAGDRHRFYGRTDLSHKLQGTILSNRCVTVYGPSGAGKSSLLQASVFPMLVERHDIRLVRVDAWPEGEDPTKWLASAISSELRFGDAANGSTKEAIFKAARAAARSSARVVVIYLDQLEQLLFPGRTVEETGPFFDCLEELVDLPLRNIRVVLSLREDYLGRFRDRLRDLRRVTDNGFRVGPLNVTELTDAVVAAAAAGVPSQSWSIEEMRSLMMQVRVPGQVATEAAETQSAYAQIICRALFQERAAGRAVDVKEAKLILQRYLASTVEELGELRNAAQQLLEDHLVGTDGSRTLRTEKELERVVSVSSLAKILKQLEQSAIIRAEEHHGSRYFEIGHDWLARRVFDQRQERERLEEQSRAEAERARQVAQLRAQQRRSQAIAGIAVTIAAVVGAAAILAWIARGQAIEAKQQAETAKQAAERAEQQAQRERDEADDLRVMAGYLALQNQGDSTGAMKLLSEVKKPEERSGWIAYANAAREKNALFVTLRGHREALRSAIYSPDGTRVLTASDDKTARIWTADGTGLPIVLAEHRGAITSAAFSPNKDSDKFRVLTTSADGTARIWTIEGKNVQSIVLAGGPATDSGQHAEITYGVWSPDGQRVVVASVETRDADPKRPGSKPVETVFVRVHSASDGTIIGEHAEHKARVNAVAVLDDTHIVSVSDDKTARVWNGMTKARSLPLAGHSAPVTFVAIHRDKGIVVTTSMDAKARVFKLGANATFTPYATLEGHTREVLHAAISMDGQFIGTASADRTARVWNIEQPPKKGTEVVLDKHDAAVTFVAFRSTDARFVATASRDTHGRVFRVDRPDAPLVLTGHTAAVGSIEWNPAGDRLVTAAHDINQSAMADHTARIFDPQSLEGMSHRGSAGANRVFHVAGFSGKRNTFAAAYEDGTVELRQTNADTEPTKFKAAHGESWGFVSAAVPSPDGKRVAIASFGADVSSGQDASGRWIRGVHIFEQTEPSKPIQSRDLPASARYVAWNETGDRIVAALENGTAMVFGANENDSPLILKGHTKWLTHAAFSADGTKVVTTSLDNTALVFEAKGNGAALGRFEHPAGVYSATFDPSGKRVATACADGKVRIFELGGGAPTELDAHGVALYRLAWSADGTRIAATTSSSTILVWSRISWPLSHPSYPAILQTDHPVAALGFVDRGNNLVAAAGDRTYTWKLDVEELKAALRDENHDCLSVDKRILYLKESAEAAGLAFRECEAAFGRVGSPEKPNPVGQSDLIVARLFIKPVDAEVECDGARVTAFDGLFTLWGKAGEKKKVRVVKDALSTEVEVTIDVSGAKPAVIDMAPLLRANAVQSKKPLAEGEGDFKSMVPEKFQ